MDRQAQQLVAAHKTVDVFSGIVRRNLWLKNSPKSYQRKPDVFTDGSQIVAPFDSPHLYRYVEHELAHILFQSNATARNRFIDEYVAKVQVVCTTQQIEFDADAFVSMLRYFIAILEDHRVNSLWAQLYYGSYKGIQTIHAVEASSWEVLQCADEDLGTYMYCIFAGVNPPSCSFDSFRPYIVEALQKVTKKGFGATLLAAKWLVTQLVSEMIRRRKNLPPPSSPVLFPSDTGNPVASAASSGTGSPGSGAPTVGTSSDDAVPKADDAVPKAGEWYPSPVAGSFQERVDALHTLSRLVPSSGSFPLLDDTKEAQFPSRQTVREAQQVAAAVTNIDTNDAKQMGLFMASSANSMAGIVATVREAMRQVMTKDAWLQKNTAAKVRFSDVPIEYAPLHPEDRMTVQKLRYQFFRILGRTRHTLGDSGIEVDVPALIQNKISHVAGDCFEHEVPGRGFDGLILLDCSGSMRGAKAEQATRACAILAKAMRFPFVRLDVWGFTSSDNGQVDIFRFNSKTRSFSTDRLDSGTTPIHLALRLGAKHLQISQNRKHIYIVTDGFPVYSNKHHRFSTDQLVHFVQTEVSSARKRGIGVTGILLGHDINASHMKIMYGHERHWKKINARKFGADLVRIVTTGFVSYLRKR